MDKQHKNCGGKLLRKTKPVRMPNGDIGYENVDQKYQHCFFHCDKCNALLTQRKRLGRDVKAIDLYTEQQQYLREINR